MTQAEPRPQDAWVDLAQGRIFVRSWEPALPPTLSPVLLFHDSLGCVALWRDFPERLCRATGRRVIAYDRLGFGLSDARTDRLSLEFIAQEAVAVLPDLQRSLAFERFVALGHSVGGGMAVHAAAQWTRHCDALITAAAQTFPEGRTLSAIAAAREFFSDPAQFQRLERYHGAKAGWVLDAWTESWLSPAFASWSLAPVLPRVRCPALVLHGSEDEYGSACHPLLIGDLSGGQARVEILPGVGHVPHRDHPEQTVSLIAEFLAALP